MGLTADLTTIAMAAYGTAVPKADIQPPKLYLCGFPKAGLHLADRMAVAMLQPWNAENNWFGTNAWTIKRHRLDDAAFVLGSLKRGYYIKGHLGYLKSFEILFSVLGIAVVFIYRDLRDVVVSQAYHMMSDREDLYLPGREKYQGMSKEDVMLIAIQGDEVVDPLFDRWETYAGWVDCEWVLTMPFEEMVLKRERAARTFFEYIHDWAMKDSGTTGAMTNTRVRQAIIRCIIAEMSHTEMSPTYRKGKTGGWKKEFTPAVERAFYDADRNGWMERLGYVN